MKTSKFFFIITMGLAVGMTSAMGMEGVVPPRPPSPRTVERQRRVREVWRAMAELEITNAIRDAYARACAGDYAEHPVTRTHEALLKECIKYDAYHGLLLAIRIYCNFNQIPQNNVEGVKISTMPGQSRSSLVEGLQRAIEGESSPNHEPHPRDPSIKKFLEIFFMVYNEYTPEHPETELRYSVDFEIIQNIYTQRCASILHIAKHILIHQFRTDETRAEQALIGHLLLTGREDQDRIKIAKFDDAGAEFAKLFLKHKDYHARKETVYKKYQAHIDMMNDFNLYIKGLTCKGCIMDDETATTRRIEKTVNEDALLHLFILTSIYDKGQGTPTIPERLGEPRMLMLTDRLGDFFRAWGQTSDINSLIRRYEENFSGLVALFDEPKGGRDPIQDQTRHARLDAVEDLVDIIQSDQVLNFFYNTIMNDIIRAIAIGFFIQQRKFHEEMIQLLNGLNAQATAIREVIAERNRRVLSGAREDALQEPEKNAHKLIAQFQETLSSNENKLAEYQGNIEKTELSFKEEGFRKTMLQTFAGHARQTFDWFNTLIRRQGQTLASNSRDFIELFATYFINIFNMAKEAGAPGEDVNSPGELAGKRHIVKAVYFPGNYLTAGCYDAKLEREQRDFIETVKYQLQSWEYQLRRDNLRWEDLDDHTKCKSIAYDYSGHVAASAFVASNWATTTQINIDYEFLRGRTGTKNWGFLPVGFLSAYLHIKLSISETWGIERSFADIQAYGKTEAERELQARPRYIPPPPPSRVAPGKLGALQQSIIGLQGKLQLVSQKLQELKR